MQQRCLVVVVCAIGKDGAKMMLSMFYFCWCVDAEFLKQLYSVMTVSPSTKEQ